MRGRIRFCHNPDHVRDAIAAIDTGLQWLECQNVDKIHVPHLKEIREIARKKKRQTLKLSTLDSFLV